MKILVTGGAGFIGSHTCRALLRRGDEVFCLDNFNDYYDILQKRKNIAQFFSYKEKFTLLEGDITDEKFLESIFLPFDCVIHLAARAGVRNSFLDPGQYFQVNVEGTKNLIRLSKKNKVSKFIFGSSSSVYGKRDSASGAFLESDTSNHVISPYALTKLEGEKLFSTSELPYTTLRFFTVYGPSGRPDMAPYKFMDNIIHGRPISIYGTISDYGTLQRDFTFVSDIVDGILCSLDNFHPGEIFNLGRGEPCTLSEFISTIEQVCKKTALKDFLGRQKGDVEFTFADISKARRIIGYSPKVSVREGILLFYDWFVSERK